PRRGGCTGRMDEKDRRTVSLLLVVEAATAGFENPVVNSSLFLTPAPLRAVSSRPGAHGGAAGVGASGLGSSSAPKTASAAAPSATALMQPHIRAHVPLRQAGGQAQLLQAC